MFIRFQRMQNLYKGDFTFSENSDVERGIALECLVRNSCDMRSSHNDRERGNPRFCRLCECMSSRDSEGGGGNAQNGGLNRLQSLDKFLMWQVKGGRIDDVTFESFFPGYCRQHQEAERWRRTSSTGQGTVSLFNALR